MKTTMLKSQNLGIMYPATKVVTFLVAVVAMTMVGDVTVQKAIRIIGWLDVLKMTLSFFLPNCFQSAFEMIVSVKRIQVLVLSKMNKMNVSLFLTMSMYTIL